MQDTPVDNLPDKWVSFAELAAARGISKASAIRLVRRHGWRRQRDNEGHVRALVPETWLNGQEDRPPDRQSDNPGDNLPDTALHVKALSVLEDALATLREAKDGEIATLRDMVSGLRDTVSRAETRAVHAEGRATEAEARIAGLESEATAKVAQAEAAADQARADVRRAQERAEALRTTVEELKAGQGMMQDIHARDLAVAQHDAQTAQQAAEELRRAEEARKAKGRLRRAWDGWRGR